MRILRTTLVAVGAALFVVLGGCHTEQSKKTVEVDRAGDQVKVKKSETHKNEKGTSKKTEEKEYKER